MCGWTDGWAFTQLERKTYSCDLKTLSPPSRTASLAGSISKNHLIYSAVSRQHIFVCCVSIWTVKNFFFFQIFIQ